MKTTGFEPVTIWNSRLESGIRHATTTPSLLDFRLGKRVLIFGYDLGFIVDRTDWGGTSEWCPGRATKEGPKWQLLLCSQSLLSMLEISNRGVDLNNTNKDDTYLHTFTFRALHCWQPFLDFLWNSLGADVRGAFSLPGIQPTCTVSFSLLGDLLSVLVSRVLGDCRSRSDMVFGWVLGLW